MDEHAFPPTGFAVAWLGCSLHYEQVGRVGRHLKCFVFMCKIHYNHQSAAILTYSMSVVVFPSKIPAPNAFSRLKLSKITLQIYVKYYVLLLYIDTLPDGAHLQLEYSASKGIYLQWQIWCFYHQSIYNHRCRQKTNHTPKAISPPTPTPPKKKKTIFFFFFNYF